MTLESYLILAHSDTALLALIALLCLFKSQPEKKRLDVKLIGLICLTGFICNALALLFARLGMTSAINIPPSIYDYLLLILVTILYNDQTFRKHQNFFKVIPVLYLVFGILNLIFFQREQINSFTKLVSALIIILYCAIYFYRMMKDLPTLEVHKLPMFWFNSGFLIYNAGTVFLFAFTSYLIHVLKDNMLIYFSFHNVLSILHHLIFVIGLVYYYRTSGGRIVTT
jgi:hypothetical protein